MLVCKPINFKDYTGQRFGNIVAMEWKYSTGKNSYWECKCDCGNVILKRADRFKDTRNIKCSKDCTCILKYEMKPRNYVNKVYGSLKIISMLENNMVEAQCDCGNVIRKDIKYIKYKKHCGCKNVPYKSRKKDYIGLKYGKLTVVERIDNKFFLLCECGKTIVRSISSAKNLTHCGCLNYKRKTDRFHRIWQGIKQRCYVNSSTSYSRYGARGITVCDRWLNFENFKEDMHELYVKHCKENGEVDTSIDRIDENYNYCPENCRWATKKVQTRNIKEWKKHIVYFAGFKYEFYDRKEFTPIKSWTHIISHFSNSDDWYFCKNGAVVEYISKEFYKYSPIKTL